MRVRLSSLPRQAGVYSLSLDRLDGGLNLFEDESRLAPNESPQMKNLYWRDGVLASRKGQRLVNSAEGEGLAAYGKLYAGYGIFHIGSCLYAVAAVGGRLQCLYSGLEEVGGSFFIYGGQLYYKTRGAYLRISEQLQCEPVAAYTPVTYINVDPITAAGDAYQPENRLSPRKTLRYNADGGAEYHLPVKGAEIVEVRVDGELVDAYTYSAESGVLSFAEAPAVSDPPANNTVHITYSLENPAAYKSIMDCRCAEVYGGAARLCVILAGSEDQPDAYFWNGSHAAMDPGYFPMEQYNLAEGTICGFGRQQGLLVIFSGSGLSRAELSLVNIDGRERIELPCVPISSVGCDLPGSICTVDDHLLFCSSESGVYRLRSTTAAGENELQHISGKVDGTRHRPGLLHAAAAGSCASADDGKRYWLAAGGEVYLWDHSVSSPNEPSWFYFTDIDAVAFVSGGEELYFLTGDGRVCAFWDVFSDFGEPIMREYKFPPCPLGGRESLKDVEKVLITAASTTDSLLQLEYISDYGVRAEPVPIRAYSWRLAPRDTRYRMLSCLRWAKSELRRPGCRHIRNFAMRVYNNEAGQDLSLISAKIFFRYRTEVR